MTTGKLECLNRQAALISAVKRGDCPRQVAFALGKSPQWAYAVLQRWREAARARVKEGA